MFGIDRVGKEREREEIASATSASVGVDVPDRLTVLTNWQTPLALALFFSLSKERERGVPVASGFARLFLALVWVTDTTKEGKKSSLFSLFLSFISCITAAETHDDDVAAGGRCRSGVCSARYPPPKRFRARLLDTKGFSFPGVLFVRLCVCCVSLSVWLVSLFPFLPFLAGSCQLTRLPATIHPSVFGVYRNKILTISRVSNGKLNFTWSSISRTSRLSFFFIIFFAFFGCAKKKKKRIGRRVIQSVEKLIHGPSLSSPQSFIYIREREKRSPLMRPPRSISLYGAIMEHPPPGGAPFRITPIRYEQLHSDKEKERKKKRRK